MRSHLDAASATIPGLVLSIIVAAAASFISEHQGGPALLYALLLGMSLKSVAEGPVSASGVAFASRSILRVGVAALGLKIGVEQVAALGWTSALLVAAGVIATIVFGLLLSRWMGLGDPFGLITGGATAICGASAALAISSVLPQTPDRERQTTFAVIAITTLSTAAMILYPAILNAFDASPHAAGFFIGATVHDVAQVVGAGYIISPEAGDTATVTKLFRVAMLVPVAVVIAALSGIRTTTTASFEVPWFLLVFVLFAALRSTGWPSDGVIAAASSVSSWCLTTAIAGVGLRTSLGDFKTLGPFPVVLVLAETVFLALFIGAGLWALAP